MDKDTQASKIVAVDLSSKIEEPSGPMTDIEITDKILLEYLIAEGGKTKAEWVDEIQERFYTFADYKTFLEKNR